MLRVYSQTDMISKHHVECQATLLKLQNGALSRHDPGMVFTTKISLLNKYKQNLHIAAPIVVKSNTFTCIS